MFQCLNRRYRYLSDPATVADKLGDMFQCLNRRYRYLSHQDTGADTGCVLVSMPQSALSVFKLCRGERGQWEWHVSMPQSALSVFKLPRHTFYRQVR